MPAKKKKCEFCLKQFFASRSDSKWCSQKCRGDFRQENAKFNQPTIPKSGVQGITFDRRIEAWTIKIKLSDSTWKYVGTEKTLIKAISFQSSLV